LTAIALDQAGKFRALRERHADAVDDDIGYFVVIVGSAEPPFDLDRRPLRQMISLVTAVTAASVWLTTTFKLSP
jgi:hypothetical protein